MSGAEAFPYPDDEPSSVRALGRSLHDVAEAVGGAMETVRGGRSSIEVRWVSPAGGRAVAEVDAVMGLGDDAEAALNDGTAPLDDYATALDSARSTIDHLRTQYDQAESDSVAALDGASMLDPGGARRALEEEALSTRTSRLSELYGHYDEEMALVRTAATTAGSALGEIAGRISPAPQSLDGDLVRANVLDQLPFMANNTGTRVLRTDDLVLVDTGDGDDDVGVTRDPDTGRVTITINGVPHRFTAEEAEDIVIRTNGGSDVIEVTPDIQLGFDTRHGFTILGGDDRDLIAGADGSDVLLGGDGDDTVVGGRGNDAMDGGDGNDRLTDNITRWSALSLPLLYDGRTVALRRGGGDDVIAGGAGDDDINGGARNDTIVAGDGADHVDAGEGDDTVDAGGGRDQVYAGEGDDRVDGGAGNDYIDGYHGNDTIDSGNGHDVLYAGEGDDTVDGGAGRDYIDGYRGDDTIDGGEGDDTVSGGADDDELTGGRDDDVIYAGAGQDAISDRFGDDVVYREEGDTVDVGERTVLVTVEIAEVPDNIHIEGTPEFQDRVRADLETLASSPVGQEMLEQIGEENDGPLWFDGDQLTIREHDEPGGLAMTGGLGADSDIMYNPDWTLDGPIPVPPIGPLQHEMAHVYNYMTNSQVGVDDVSSELYLGPDARGVPPGVDADHDGRVTFDEIDRNDDGTIWDDDLDLDGDGDVDDDDGWEPNAERQANGLPVDHDGDPGTPAIDASIIVNHPPALTMNALLDEMGLPERPSYP